MWKQSEFSNQKKTAPAFLFFSALLWSTSGIFTKTVNWDGISLATLRGTIAFLIFGFLIRKRKLILNRQKLLVAVCFFLQSLFFMCANKYTTAANASVLQNTSLLFIIFFNFLCYRKTPSITEIATCIALAFGVILAFAGNFGNGKLLGDSLAVISAIFYAGVFFFSKEKGSDPMESLFLGNTLYLFLIPFCFGKNEVLRTTMEEWLFLFLFATLSGTIAWLCFARGIRNTSALQANFITMSEPVMAPIWTFIALGEEIPAVSLLGCGIVICTILVYNIVKIRESEQKETTGEA